MNKKEVERLVDKAYAEFKADLHRLDYEKVNSLRYQKVGKNGLRVNIIATQDG